MVPAEMDRTQIVIDLGRRSEQFVATGEVVRFDGFMRLYSETVDDDAQQEGEGGILPKMNVGDKLTAASITASERYTQAPARYNEAALVKRLEELGIGRPSTYAPTITTIINRGYVVKQNREGQKRQTLQLTLSGSKIAEKMVSESYGKEKNRLAPTDIGMVVNDYLETQFSTIMDYHFTANVEKEFDRVAEGDITWHKMIAEFYDPFHQLVDLAIGTQVEKNYQTARILGVDPKSGHSVQARIGRYGPMVELIAPNGEKGQSASLKKGQLIESITLEEALDLFALPRNLGELDGEPLMVGIGKFGPYVRHGKTFASLSKSDDPYTITRERAEELLKENNEKVRSAATPLKTFEEDPAMLIKSGIYGAYIAYNGKNYRLPKGAKIETLSYTDCQRIVAKAKK
jgi:DNA topoisomerase-1